MLGNLCILMLVALVELSQAQRPSFAGMRPPGGLNQKDKYLGTQNTAVENFSGLSIANRFGEESVAQQTPTINLPYGASQKPPIGVPLVLPISAYVPDPVPAVPTSTASVANRFGGNDATVPLSGDSFRPTVNTPTLSAGSPVVSNALPIDAHGDRDYVNHLSTLPEDNRPFWFLNYQAIEALRNSTRPNVNALENRGSFFAG
ncbi:uncharacterized protein LOC117788565 [Drosophila innubila]|uniref:uncharacterized protein LOC117788565 n=1 Tax=Drosophila innubila TaxID=198719 RepID=UPI00148CE43F|nr:uncharacterized protein LOC117788565 [Drosophila innubila]